MTKVFRDYLAEMADDRVEAGKQAMLSVMLSHDDQVRIACEVAILSQMADPQFDVVGLFYEKSRMTQEEWDAHAAAEAEVASEDGAQVNDPDAEEEEDDDAAQTSPDGAGPLSD